MASVLPSLVEPKQWIEMGILLLKEIRRDQCHLTCRDDCTVLAKLILMLRYCRISLDYVCT